MKRKLSTIEMTVLGLTWLRGPCTIYAVMKELSSSGSSYYKSRAGTAYSVANRLAKYHYIDSVEGAERDLISISEKGKEALVGWLTPPLPLADIAHSADLVRLRFFFLGALPQETRIAFIDHTIVSLREVVATSEHLIHENECIGDSFGALATVSLLLETKARIRWLQLVRAWIVSPPPEDGTWAEKLIRQASESSDSLS